MSENLFNYNPIQEWTGDVVDFGLPTTEGNTLITEIVTSSLNAGDATQRCFELAKQGEYFVLAGAPETLTLVRYFFSGKSELLETLSIASVLSFIESFVSGSGISLAYEQRPFLVDTDDNGELNLSSKFVQKCDIFIDRGLEVNSSLKQSVDLKIQYKPIAAPQQLNAADAEPSSPGVVIVVWNPIIDSVSYNIYRSINKQAFDYFDPSNLASNQTLLSNEVNNTLYDTTLTNIGTYYYWVSALYLDPWDNGTCSDSTSEERVVCEEPRGSWVDIPGYCDGSPLLNTPLECTTGGLVWVEDASYCTNGDYSDQIECELPNGTWTTYLRESLLAPDLVQCSITVGCSLPEFTTQFACEDSNRCIHSIDDTEFLTRKVSVPDTYIPALYNETDCEISPNNSNSTGCYYSSNPSNEWLWSSYNAQTDPTESGCLGSWANSNNSYYYIWFDYGTTQWTGDSGNWITDVWSPELCHASNGVWTFAHPGEEGSVTGDPYIELVDNMTASEAESLQITVSWTSNPTVDPLIGECAECLDGTTVISIPNEPDCINTGDCTDASLNNQPGDCIADGMCYDFGLLSTRYSGYAADDFDNDFNWFDTATVQSENVVPIVNYPDDGTEYFARKIQGYFVAPEDGNHRFRTKSDDSSWVWIGEADEPIHTLIARRDKTNEIIDNSGSHPAQTVTSANINLVAGKLYPILIYYGQGYGGTILEMQYDPPSSGWTFGSEIDFRTKNYQYSTLETCEALMCSDPTWALVDDCTGAGSCSYVSYDNDQEGCTLNGACYTKICTNYFFGWCTAESWVFQGNDLNIAECFAIDSFENQYDYQSHVFTSDNNSWQVQYDWGDNNFSSAGYNWADYPQWNDASTCVSNLRSWIPDATVQNTPDSYNVYRATEPNHLLTPSEYEFIANVPHVGNAIEIQTYIDTAQKTKFALYYYKVTQVSGGVESEFSQHDTGWQDT